MLPNIRVLHLIYFLCLMPWACVQAADDADAIGHIVDFTGTIYIKSPGSDPVDFTKPKQGPKDIRPIQAGWIVTVDKNSRCRIQLRDNNVVSLAPYSTVRFDKKTDNKLSSRLLKGVMSFFHRDKPGEMEVESSEVAAVIYGTEFVFAVTEDGTTTLSLYDGHVKLPDGSEFQSGDVMVAKRGQKPKRTASIDYRNLDAIQWNLYYPAILNIDDLDLSLDARTYLEKSLRAYVSGDLLAALSEYPSNRQPTEASERVYYAALLASVGNVAESQSVLDGIVAGRQARLAVALRQLIDSVKFQAKPPATAPPGLLSSEWMSLSYAYQSCADLRKARECAREAIRIAPEFGFAYARLAELEFSFGANSQAKMLLDKALQLSNRNAQAHALNGFLLCSQNKYKAAQQAFETAIEMDCALGNAWLGRGLCRIRQGDRTGGRQDLEVAASSEPQRSLLRSYLGKAFFEEKEWDKAFYELDLAKTIDPLDPTAWLYSALLKQNRNRVNEAIADLEQSKKLYNNRQIYRSRLMLDQDKAVRSANLAALYRDAGMTEVAANEAARASGADYGNASAHAFLANAYDALRDPNGINLRYETPWNSELLLANLLAPPGVGMLSQNISQQEYSRLFDLNRVGLLSSTYYSSQGDWQQSASQYGNYDRLSYAMDFYYRDANGQHIKDDHQTTVFNVQAKMQITPQDGVIVLSTTKNDHAGDLTQYYDPNQASEKFHLAECQDPSIWLGWHRNWSPESHTLLLAGRSEDTLRFNNWDAQTLLLKKDAKGVVQSAGLYPYTNPPPYFQTYQRELALWGAELQQIWIPGNHTVLLGVRSQTADINADSKMDMTANARFGNPPYSQHVNANFNRLSAYLYETWRPGAIAFHAGLSYDYLDYPVNADWTPVQSGQEYSSRINPKAGFEWEIRTNTHLRGAWTRSLGGAYYDQSVRLEPAQIAGFTQAYRSLLPESTSGLASGLFPGARFETWGLGLEHRFKTRTYLTLQGEWLRENADRSIGVFDWSNFVSAAPASLAQQIDYDEKAISLALNQLVGRDWSFGFRYRISQAELETQYPSISSAVQQTYATRYGDSHVLFDETDRAILQEIRFSALWNHPSGLYWRAESHWHGQDNRGDMDYMRGDSCWQFDTYLGYRFWQRRANAQIGLLNIFDRDYRLNPFNLYQELPRNRTFTAQLKLSF